MDDLLLTGEDEIEMKNFRDEMKQHFEMTDLGVMSYFLGMEIHQTDHGIFISQKKYAEEILRKFKMENCKPTETSLGVNEKLSKKDGAGRANEGAYRSSIGSLLYLTSTRPDLIFTTSLRLRFMHSPSDIHFKTAKRVLRYLKGTTGFGVWFEKSLDGCLRGYSDSDWASSMNDMKSTSGYCFSFSSGIFS